MDGNAEINVQTQLLYRTLRDKLRIAHQIIQHNFPGICITKEYSSGNFVILVPKHDEISRTCPISNRQHSSNSIYFSVARVTGCVSVKCFKSECEGSRQLTMEEKLFQKIAPTVTISEKKTKFTSISRKPMTIPDLEHITVENFEHNPIFLDEKSCYDLYQSLNFVHVKARKHEKRPVFSGWTKSSFSDNSEIKIAENNVAIVTGTSSNIFVLDIDVKDGGLDWWKRFASKNNYNYVNSTLAVLTPSGGVHLYYKYDDQINKNSVRMKTESGTEIGLDIRSNDGCVIAPPSKYTNGNYVFICLKSPQLCPGFIRDLLICEG